MDRWVASGSGRLVPIPISREIPLLSYAALHWYEHARNLSCTEDIFDLSNPIRVKKSPIRKAWLSCFSYKPTNYSNIAYSIAFRSSASRSECTFTEGLDQ